MIKQFLGSEVNFENARIEYQNPMPGVEELVFVITQLGFSVTNLKSKKTQIVSFKESLSPYEKLNPNSNSVLSKTQLLPGFLFVAFEVEGILVYKWEAKKSTMVFVGIIDSSYFKKGTEELSIKDFTISEHNLSVFERETDDLKKMCQDCGTFFDFSYNQADYIEKIKENKINQKVMFILESSGVFILSLDFLLRKNPKLPKKLFDFHLKIFHGKKIERFKNQLIVLTRYKKTDKAIIEEWFIKNANVNKWRSTKDFILNRKIQPKILIDNFYIDESFIYLLGEEKHVFLLRGIESKFVPDNQLIERYFEGFNISSLKKFFYKGKRYFFIFSKNEFSISEAEFSGPSLKCPYEKSQYDMAGTFVIEVNATTRDCPDKSQLEKNGEFVQNVCVFTKRFEFEIPTFLENLSQTYDKSGYIGLTLSLIMTFFLICFCYTLLKNSNPFSKQSERINLDLKSRRSELEKFTEDEKKADSVEDDLNEDENDEDEWSNLTVTKSRGTEKIENTYRHQKID